MALPLKVVNGKLIVDGELDVLCRRGKDGKGHRFHFEPGCSSSTAAYAFARTFADGSSILVVQANYVGSGFVTGAYAQLEVPLSEVAKLTWTCSGRSRSIRLSAIPRRKTKCSNNPVWNKLRINSGTGGCIRVLCRPGDYDCRPKAELAHRPGNGSAVKIGKVTFRAKEGAIADWLLAAVPASVDPRQQIRLAVPHPDIQRVDRLDASGHARPNGRVPSLSHNSRAARLFVK